MSAKKVGKTAAPGVVGLELGALETKRAVTVGHLVCSACDTEIGRFPYWLMYDKWKEPKPVCRPCYRTAMMVQWLAFNGAISFKGADE